MKTFLVIAAALTLVACSGEPSENELRQTVRIAVEHANLGVARMGGSKELMMAVPVVRKNSCKADGENAYRCDVEFTVDARRQIESTRFVKGSAGWKVDCKECERLDALAGPPN